MVQARISLLLPTRARPQLVRRLFDSIAATTTNPKSIDVVMYVDEDDTGSHDLDSDRFEVVRIIGPRASMGAYNTACLSRAKGDVIVLVNDDMVIRTPGWDDIVRELDSSFPDRVYLGYGNDMLKGKGLCTFPILSRRTCELLADPYPVAYRGAFIDFHLFDVFKRLQNAGFDRIRYLDNLVFEHLHYRTGKAAYDETYARRGRFADDGTFLALVGYRRALASRLLYALRDGEEQVPVTGSPPIDESVPRNLGAALLLYARRLLLDDGLPWRWRLYLWVWFSGRYMAAAGWLRPFVKP